MSLCMDINSISPGCTPLLGGLKECHVIALFHLLRNHQTVSHRGDLRWLGVTVPVSPYPGQHLSLSVSSFVMSQVGMTQYPTEVWFLFPSR